MMDQLEIPGLGTLSIREVYDYYDCARLFYAEHSTGQKVLAVWVETEDECDRWLFVPVSNQKLQNLKTKRLSLHNVFRYPEGGFAWEVRTWFDGRPAVAAVLDEANISPE